jgi:hypothetical protein
MVGGEDFFPDRATIRFLIAPRGVVFEPKIDGLTWHPYCAPEKMQCSVVYYLRQKIAVSFDG